MARAAKVTVDLETRVAGWTKGLSASGSDTVKWAKGIQGTIKGLTLGMGKDLDAVGVGKFGGSLASSAKEAKDLATALRTGGNQAELLSNFVSGIPIVGKFHEAGMAIRELFTGAQAAKIETLKQVEAVKELSAAYAELRAANLIRGKYGDEREAQQIENAKDRRLADIANRRNDLKMDVMRMQEVQSNSLHWVTDAEKRENERKKKQITELNLETIAATKDYEQDKLKLSRDAAERQRQFLRGEEEQQASFEERSAAKSLKAQGRLLEARIHMAQADANQAIRSEQKDKLSEESLRGLSPEDRAGRFVSVNKTIQKIQADTQETIADMKFESDRREQAEATDNENRLREITANGNIERLKIQDEAINAGAEKRGQARRSHLAEAAQVEEEYRRQVAEVQKKYLSDNRVQEVDYRDANVRAQINAAAEERRQKLGLLGEKGDNEAAKNQEATLKEQRRLWEEAGKPAEKYAAHLADINEHFDKFHDLNLKNAELHSMDKSTLTELKHLNPDHESPIQLYGRTGSYADAKVGGAGTAIAQQQLDAMRKQASHADTWQVYFRDIWDYIRKQTAGVVPELNI